MADSVASKIYGILSDEFRVSRSEISDQVGPGDLPKWDSIGQILLMTRLEREFRIQFTPSDMMAINTVKDLIDTVKKKTDKKEIKEVSVKRPSPQGLSISRLRLPKRIFWGEGSFASLSGLDRPRIAGIVGSSKYALALKERVEKLLIGKKVFFYQKGRGETHESDALRLSEKLREESPKAIVAIGGGSCIDLAKLGWALYEHPDRSLDDFITPFTLPPLRRRSIFVAIPTTFGTGAEVSSAATFGKERALGKTILVSHEFIPDQAILDPSLGKGTPLPIVYSSAFDALTHAIEGYVSIVRNPLVEPYAVFAIQNILGALLALKKEKLSKSVLGRLCDGAFYAGVVQNHCSVGLTHAFAHQLGTFGVSHGQANALFLIAVMERNAKETDRYDSLVAACGFPSFLVFSETVRRFIQEADLTPEKRVMKEIARRGDAIIEGAMADLTFKTNPVSLKKREVTKLFEEVLRQWKK